MPDPIPTPQGQQSGAAIIAKRREDAIKAAAVKVGRTAERNDILKALGTKSLEEAGGLATMQKQHADEIHRLNKLVGSRAFMTGLTIGLSVAIVVGCAALVGGNYMAERNMMTLVAADRARTARANLPADIEPLSQSYELNAREPRDAP